MRLAQERGLLPTTLGSAEIQELTLRLKQRAFFSARTANLQYLDKLKKLVDRAVKGEGINNDLAQLRIEARQMLAQLGYTPEGGFPGDVELGIPPATAGSLRDLSSQKRLDLIFDTQVQQARGLGLKLRGDGRADRWPAWELVRVAKFTSEHQREWLKRWKIAADNVDWEGVSRQAFEQGRMIALKSSPIWQALSSSALFPDGLNDDHPPFAFNSGMGWREVPLEECRGLGDLMLDGLDAKQRAFLGDQGLSEQDRHFLGKDAGSVPPPVPATPAQKQRLQMLLRLKAKFEERERRRAT